MERRQFIRLLAALPVTQSTEVSEQESSGKGKVKLAPYAHECIDRPHLPCPACEWQKKRFVEDGYGELQERFVS